MKRRLVILLVIVVLVLSINRFLDNSSGSNALDELELKRGAVGEVLEEREVRDGEVVFYMRQDGERASVLSADYINKSFLGWKWSAGGGHSLPDSSGVWSHQYIAATKGNFLNHSPFPLVFGSIANQSITAIILKSVETGEEITAEVIASTIKPETKLWYAFITEEQGKSFEIAGLSSTGEVVSKSQF